MKISDLFKYKPNKKYSFVLTPVTVTEAKIHDSEKKLSTNIDSNLKHIKNKYSSLINSDIQIREFYLTARNTRI